MTYFIWIFSLIVCLVFIMDRYFYFTISNILSIKGFESIQVLDGLGYYNKSIFRNKIYIFIISLFVTLLIYLAYRYKLKKHKKILDNDISSLEKDLMKINSGDYSIKIHEDDGFDILRDEMYKIVINLKSIEEEASRQKILLKNDLSNIAHQLKTPITSIGFMAELIEEDRENTMIYLEKLEVELEKLKKFTEILLKLSKLNANAVEYKFIKLSTVEIIEDILKRLNVDKNININYKGDELVIYGDEVWLYEGFLNILKNSLEHTKDEISIYMESNPIYKLIKISDNGSGVDKEELDRIFDRFYRGDISIPGYGIGLNLSKTIIEGHGGEIRAYNNHGLTFEIKFYNVT